MRALQDVLKLDGLRIDHVYSTELDDDKRDFGHKFFSPQYRFKDVLDMPKSKATDFNSGDTVDIPSVQKLWGGFPCQDDPP